VKITRFILPITSGGVQRCRYHFGVEYSFE